MDTSRLILLLRAKWRLEHTARLAAAGFADQDLPETQFVYEPFAERLVLACAYDHGDHFEYVDARDLERAGVSASQALDCGLENMRSQLGDSAYFQKMPEFGWMP